MYEPLAPGISELRALEAAVAALCGGLDPEAIPLSDAPETYECLARIERVAAGARLRMARRVEASHAWRRTHRSAAEYLARHTGTSVTVAQGALQASKRLAEQPAVEEAVQQGALSTNQAEVIADAAAVNPGAARQLVHEAQRSTFNELREACGRAKAAGDSDPEATHRRIHARRFLRRATDAEGAFVLTARGTVDAGARISAALDPVIDSLFQEAKREGREEPREAYAFDALLHCVGARTRARGASPPPPASEAPKPGSAVAPAESAPRPPERFLALLRVDLEALRRGSVGDGETCEITGLGPIPAAVARSLLGESILKLVITRGVDVAHVTHLGRGPSAAQRIALLWSQPRCSNQECSRSLFLQVDHRTPWAAVHRTVLHDLDRLCDECHDLKSYKGWALVPGKGRRALVPPHDPRHPGKVESSRPPPPRPEHPGSDPPRPGTPSWIEPALFPVGAG